MSKRGAQEQSHRNVRTIFLIMALLFIVIQFIFILFQNDSFKDKAIQNKNISTTKNILKKFSDEYEVAKVVAGIGRTCLITTDNQLFCWGLNYSGKIGNGRTGLNEVERIPVKILDDVRSVRMGEDHNCAITTNDKLYCWGDNNNGQIGNGKFENEVVQQTPALVLEDVKSVSLGHGHTCAVKINGKLFCWGDNFGGIVGNGGNDYVIPTPVEVLGDVINVESGDEHNCAITTNNKLYCWGNNQHGQVGNGNLDIQRTPVKVLDDVVSVFLRNASTCALKTNGKLFCWGNVEDNELKNLSDLRNLTPIEVLDDVKSVGIGVVHICAIKTNGRLYCWGSNEEGEVGNGSTLIQLAPIEILDDITSIYLGAANTCAIKTNGDLYCWGENREGQIGNGKSGKEEMQLTPIKVLEDVKSVSIGGGGDSVSHTCALKTDGKLFCWGDKDLVGNGGYNAKNSTPVEINFN